METSERWPWLECLKKALKGHGRIACDRIIILLAWYVSGICNFLKAIFFMVLFCFEVFFYNLKSNKCLFLVSTTFYLLNHLQTIIFKPLNCVQTI